VVAFLIGGIYYYFALPALEKAPKGLSNLDIPYMQIEDKASENENERVTLVPVSNIETIDLLMDFATTITSDQRSEVVPFHVAQVSTTIPLDSNYTYFKESVEHYDRIIKRLEVYAKKIVAIKPIIIFSRDIVHAIVSHTKETKAEFLLLGWHPTGLATNMHNGIVHRILEVAPTTVGILKAINTQDIDRILFPYGGGSYAQATAKVVRRVAKAYGAEVTMVHIMNDYDEETYDKVKKEMDFAVKGLGSEVKTLIVKGELKEKVIELSNEYDLIVMGASLEWGLKEFITGSLTDEIMEKVNCSALLVRPYTSMLQNKKVRSILGKIKHKYHV
jgi:nucleotide-binding universal stress UspA family protein